MLSGAGWDHPGISAVSNSPSRFRSAGESGAVRLPFRSATVWRISSEAQPTALGQREHVGPAILRVTVTPDVSGFLHPVDQPDHDRSVDTEFLGQIELREPITLGQRFEHSQLARVHARTAGIRIKAREGPVQQVADKV